jgi:hypothetical protein
MTLPEFLTAKVIEYNRDHFQDLENLLNYYNQLLLPEAKAIAVFGPYIDPDGNTVPNEHVKKINVGVLQQAQNRLKTIKDETLNSRKNFDDLYRLVDDNIREHGLIADMVCYDASLRLGATLRKLPKKVYVQHGAKVGAELLTSFDLENVRSIQVSLLPEELHPMEPCHIEKFLCVYHDDIQNYYTENGLVSIKKRKWKN